MGKRVRMVENGPMLVDGPLEITLPDGKVVTSDRFVVAICMCRRSKNYPLCDTSHRSHCHQQRRATEREST